MNHKNFTLENSLNLQRRNFLQLALKAGGGIAVAGLLPTDAMAFEDLPPGIQNCRDKGVGVLYNSVGGIFAANFWGADVLAKGGRDGSMQIFDPNSYKIEPALYFTSYKVGNPHSRQIQPHMTFIGENLKDINLALHYFDIGTYHYFKRYVVRKNNRGGSKEKIEEYYLMSIFHAAYGIPNSKEVKAKIAAIDKKLKEVFPSETHALKRERKKLLSNGQKVGAKVAQYLSADLSGRERLLIEARDLLLALKSNKEDREPNDGYNRQLVAQWSGFMLAVHFDNIDKKSGNGEMINGLIEKPLRNYVGKVRGPPYYGI